MNIVISAQGVKREIEGPFEICLSTDDRERLIECLKSLVHDGTSYRWVIVHDEVVVPSIDGPALPWVVGAST